MSLQRLVYIDGQQAVLYKGLKHNPTLGRNFESKMFHVDPLTCTKCGGKLKIIAYLHDQVAISKILDHLGLSPPQNSKPPPVVHEVVRVPVDEEGREIEGP